MKIAKTNAARLLDKLKLEYSLHQAEVDLNDLSALNMANKLQVDPLRVFKTLVCRGDKHGILLACIPGSLELNLKALAQESGNKHVELVPLKEVFTLTGYVRGGCSPLACKKAYPVFLDAQATRFQTIYVSAGLRGVQLELAPKDLITATKATLADLSRQDSAEQCPK